MDGEGEEVNVQRRVMRMRRMRLQTPAILVVVCCVLSAVDTVVLSSLIASRSFRK